MSAYRRSCECESAFSIWFFFFFHLRFSLSSLFLFGCQRGRPGTLERKQVHKIPLHFCLFRLFYIPYRHGNVTIIHDTRSPMQRPLRGFQSVHRCYTYVEARSGSGRTQVKQFLNVIQTFRFVSHCALRLLSGIAASSPTWNPLALTHAHHIQCAQNLKFDNFFFFSGSRISSCLFASFLWNSLFLLLF